MHSLSSGPQQHILGGLLDESHRDYRVDVFGEHNVVLLIHLWSGPELSACASYNRSRWDHGWVRQPALLARLPERRVCVERVVSHVANYSETGIQKLNAVGAASLARSGVDSMT